jgi:hypothetical protein
MPGTEIDDIFSGKASTTVEPKAVPSGVGDKRKSGATKTTTVRDGEGKKRQRKKNGKEMEVVASYKRGEEEVEGTSKNETKAENQEGEEPANWPTKKSKKRPRDEVEEVVDPSITVKRQRVEKDGKRKKSKAEPATTNKGDGIKTGLDKFKDSRGAGGRRLLTCRVSEDGRRTEGLFIYSGKRTEEGFPIYTEEELGMGNEGGGMSISRFPSDFNLIQFWEQILHFAHLIVTAVRSLNSDYRTVPLIVFL